MVSLSRYALRIGIVFALIVTLLTMISATIITNSVQSNIVSIQEQRIDYLDNDSNIIDHIIDLTTLYEIIVSEQLELFLTNYLDQNSDTTTLENKEDFLDQLSALNLLLLEREETNYQITGIDNGPLDLYVMFQQIPETTDIISTGEDGAYNTINSFANSAEILIEFITDSADSVRSNLNLAKDQLDDGNEEVEVFLHEYDESLSEFERSLFDNGTVEALQLLELNQFVNSNITHLIDQYNHLLYRLFDTPLDVSTSEFSSELVEVRANIEIINASVIAFGMSPVDQSLYGSIVGNITGLFDVLEVNVDDHIFDIITSLGNIQNLITNTLASVTESFSTAVNFALTKIEDEIIVFDNLTAEFLNNVVASSSTITILIFATLTAIVTLVFLWIILTLGRNIGRILDKMSKLAEGDLTTKMKSKYGNNEIGLIERNLDTFSLQMRSILTSMKQSSETLAGIAEELSAGAEEATASISEVNQTVREFTSGSSEQNLMLNRVRNELIQHLTIVEQTANSIDETAKFVLRVAKRTNILGLNASIEAAKAGRFGLGFNVVAEEVRSLSDETQDSANRIASSIETIEFNIRQTVQDILDEVNIIREVAENTATGSEDASLATAEQVVMMNEVTQTSAQLSELSNALNQMMQNFTV